MSEIRWAVYRDRFPLHSPELLPLVVTAPDKPAAERLAGALAGCAVLVRSMLSREVAAAAAPLGPRRLPRRRDVNQAKQRYREFAAEKRRRAQTNLDLETGP